MEPKGSGSIVTGKFAFPPHTRRSVRPVAACERDTRPALVLDTGLDLRLGVLRFVCPRDNGVVRGCALVEIRAYVFQTGRGTAEACGRSGRVYGKFTTSRR